MLFSAVLIAFPNAKDCLKGEWSIDLGDLNNLKFSTMLFVVLNRLGFFHNGLGFGICSDFYQPWLTLKASATHFLGYKNG